MIELVHNGRLAVYTINGYMLTYTFFLLTLSLFSIECIVSFSFFSCCCVLYFVLFCGSSSLFIYSIWKVYSVSIIVHNTHTHVYMYAFAMNLPFNIYSYLWLNVISSERHISLNLLSTNWIKQQQKQQQQPQPQWTEWKEPSINEAGQIYFFGQIDLHGGIKIVKVQTGNCLQSSKISTYAMHTRLINQMHAW